jgi:signal transduction histidine kinase
MHMRTTDTPREAQPALPPQRGAPLRTYLLLLTLVAIVPLLVFAAAAVLTDAQQERAAMELRMTDKAAQVATAVDAELQRTIGTLQAIGRSGSIARGDLRDFHEFAARLKDAEPGWGNLLLLGPGGEHLLNARMPYGAALPPLNRSDLVVAAAKAGRPLVSPLVPAAVARRDLVAVYVPVGPPGGVSYVLAAGIEPANWKKLLESRMPPDMNAVLLDRDSVVITSTDLTERNRAVPAVRTAFLPTGQRLVLRAGAERVRREILNDIPVYVSTSRAPMSGLTVATIVPVDEVAGGLLRSVLPLAGGAAGLLVLVLLLAGLLAGSISRSILSLVHGVEAVAAGASPQAEQDRVLEVQQARQALLRTAERMTEQLRREAALREQLEGHERARNAFLAVLGHELRNPLAPLRNAVLILQRAEGREELVRKAGTVLDRQTSQLVRLVDDLLDVTRIQNGKIDLRKGIVDVAELARHVLDDHDSAARAAQIDLVPDLPSTPALVVGDPARLTQVIGNLLTNACKFTPPLGTVHLRVQPAGASVRIVVQDSGAGIPADALRAIFEPFVQGPQEGARTRGGLGLGLALVDALVRMHGGSVSAASDGLGHGSVFVVELPLADPGAVRAVQADAEPAARRSEPAQPRDVLIVDDDVDGAQTLAQLVEAMGHAPRTAPTAAAALAACRERRPDVILCDIALPGADGYSLARQVRADARLAGTKLVALSGHALPEHRSASADAGFDLHLAKPATVQELEAALG